MLRDKRERAGFLAVERGETASNDEKKECNEDDQDDHQRNGVSIAESDGPAGDAGRQDEWGLSPLGSTSRPLSAIAARDHPLRCLRKPLAVDTRPGVPGRNAASVGLRIR